VPQTVKNNSKKITKKVLQTGEKQFGRTHKKVPQTMEKRSL